MLYEDVCVLYSSGTGERSLAGCCEHGLVFLDLIYDSNFFLAFSYSI
jgi:hypothetical protein